MSLRDTVSQALSADLPQSRDQIIEETGLDQRQVTNCLDQLRRAGKCTRTAEGWLAINGAPAEAATPPPERKPRGRPKTKTPKKLNGGAGHPVIRPGNGHEAAHVAFARFGEYVVLKREDVAALIAMLDRWRAVVDA